MVRLGSVGITYFVVGALFYGSGLISWEEAGIATYFFSSPGTKAVDGGALGGLQSTGGAIESIGAAVTGPILAIWNLLTTIIGFLGWPVGALLNAGVPWEGAILLGGTFVVALFFAIVNTVVRAA